MKTIFNLAVFGLAVASLGLVTHACAQGSGITYQGLLQQSGVPYTGLAEFQPTLWDAASGGATVAVNNPATLQVGVTNGLFVLPLNFGANFPGAGRWLQIDVRTNNGAFTPLLPRQAITATPYALTASNLSGPLPATQISGVLASGQLGGSYGGAVTFNNAANSFAGNGANLTTLNASQLTTGTVPDARLAANVARTSQVWLLGGNAGASPVLGTLDNQPLLLYANSQLALRLIPTGSNSVNVLGGYSGNFIAPGVVGATVSGGGAGNFNGTSRPNRATNDFATVVGGRNNLAGGFASTAMGDSSFASGDYSIAMGTSRSSGFGSTAMGSSTASSFYSTAMGYNCTASGSGSTAMGYDSVASGDYSTAVGKSTASGLYSTALGYSRASGIASTAVGSEARALHDGAVVWSDRSEIFFPFVSTAPNQFLIRAAGGVGIGLNNPAAPLHVEGGSDASIAGGGYLIIGPDNGVNLIFDNNEIIARDGRLGDTLFLNNGSGPVQTGASLGVGRAPAANALEVAGNASKSAAGSWLANSDARIKQPVAPVTNALATLDRVRLVSFDYTGDYRDAHPEVESRRHLNVIAQEFQQVFPEHVKPSGEKLADGSEILQVDTYPLTIYSAAAVQELNRKVQSLQEQNAALLRRLEAMEARMR